MSVAKCLLYEVIVSPPPGQSTPEDRRPPQTTSSQTHSSSPATLGQFSVDQVNLIIMLH